MITKYNNYIKENYIDLTIKIDFVIPFDLYEKLHIVCMSEYINYEKAFNKILSLKYVDYYINTYKQCHFLNRYIIYYLVTKLNTKVDNLYYSTNHAIETELILKVSEIFDLINNLPTDLSQDTIDNFCEDYLTNSKYKNIKFLKYYFNGIHEYLFSDKIKDKYYYLINANNFDLL